MLRSPLHGDRKRLPVLAGGLAWLVLAVLATVLLYYADAKARLEAAGSLRASLGEVRDEIDRRLETALAVPETLAAVIAAEERIEPDTFNAVASRLVRANPSIRNVALAPGGVITAIHPVRGNEAALGLRYADIPTQNAAVQQAIRTRRTVISGPVALVQGGTGLVSRTPVFLRGESGRDTRYWGIVSLVVNVDELFTDIARIADRNAMVIAVRQSEPGAASDDAIAGDPLVFAATPVTMRYPLPGGGSWELAAIPRGGWAAVKSVPWIVRVLLHLLALLLGWTTYRMLARHDRDLMLADRDALTGLLNRKSFDHALETALLQGKAGGCALVLIDLDQFKPVNDIHGHRVGDLVLQQIGDRLQQFEHGLDAAYRLGGDEFALLLQGERAMRDLFRQVERATELIRQPVVLDQRRSISVGASVGVAVFPLGTEDESAIAVFDRADRALYRCKAQGGSRVQGEPHDGHEPGR